jgi:glutamine cyclotransferase
MRVLGAAALLAAGASCGCHREPEPMQKGAVVDGAVAIVAGSTSVVPHGRVPTIAPRSMASMAHERAWFTQGLAFWDGRLFEGTGMYGESLVQELDAHTGSELRHATDDVHLFGEGITIFHGELFQLTWKEHVCEVFDPDSLRKRREIPYEGEGWGMTSDGEWIVTSDGSDVLSYRDPGTFRVVRKVPVTFDGRPLDELNELENVRGEIWANVWQSDFIVRISPKDGRVVGRLDLSGIQPAADRSGDPDDVLNGIAFDERGGRLLITGKRWTRIFEIEAPLAAP